MAITSYLTLRQQVAAWLNRSDLTAQIPVFIQLAERKLRRRLAGMPDIPVLTDQAPANWLLTAHPDVYLYATLVESAPYLQDDERVVLWEAQLENRLAEVLRSRTATASSLATYAGLQSAVARWLDRADLGPVVPSLISMAEARLARDLAGMPDIPALSGTQTTNWLLASHPDVYLYATLVEAAPYLPDDARIDVWKSQLAERLPAVVRSRTAVPITITTFAGFQDAVVRWLDRADLSHLTTALIALAEAKLRRRFRGITPIATPPNTNWLFEAHPDAYLYATLVEAEPYLGNDARVALWREAYDTAIQTIRRPDTAAIPTTYAGLLRSVTDTIDRPDLDTVAPRFVRLAEKMLSRDPRVRRMTCRGTWTISGDGDRLPADFREVDTWYYDGPVLSGPIALVAPEELAEAKRRHGGGVAGAPRYAAIRDRRMYYAPSPDQTYVTRMAYWRRVFPLSESAPTNWMLEEHPDIYLYAALIESAPYLGDDARIATWKTLLEERLDSLHISTWDETPGGRLSRVMRPIGG